MPAYAHVFKSGCVNGAKDGLSFLNEAKKKSNKKRLALDPNLMYWPLQLMARAFTIRNTSLPYTLP